DALQVQHVKGVVHGLQDAHAARARGQLGLQLEQHLQVQGELVDLGFEDRQVHASGGVKPARGRSLDVAFLGRKERVVVQQHRVGGCLDKVVHLLVALGGVGNGDPLVARVDGLYGAAVGPVDQAFALE